MEINVWIPYLCWLLCHSSSKHQLTHILLIRSRPQNVIIMSTDLLSNMGPWLSSINPPIQKCNVMHFTALKGQARHVTYPHPKWSFQSEHTWAMQCCTASSLAVYCSSRVCFRWHSVRVGTQITQYVHTRANPLSVVCLNNVLACTMAALCIR